MTTSESRPDTVSISHPVDSIEQKYPGDIIPLRLPSAYHWGSEHQKPEAERYNLSGEELPDYIVTLLAGVLDPFTATDNQKLMAVSDAAWLYAVNSINNGEPIDVVFATVEEFMLDAAAHYKVAPCYPKPPLIEDDFEF